MSPEPFLETFSKLHLVFAERRFIRCGIFTNYSNGFNHETKALGNDVQFSLLSANIFKTRHVLQKTLLTHPFCSMVKVTSKHNISTLNVQRRGGVESGFIPPDQFRLAQSEN